MKVTPLSDVNFGNNSEKSGKIVTIIRKQIIRLRGKTSADTSKKAMKNLQRNLSRTQYRDFNRPQTKSLLHLVGWHRLNATSEKVLFTIYNNASKELCTDYSMPRICFEVKMCTQIFQGLGILTCEGCIQFSFRGVALTFGLPCPLISRIFSG